MNPRYIDAASRALMRLEMQGDCWVWPGWSGQGYGKIWLRNPEGSIGVHRLLYLVLVGPIPVGLELDHLCRNRACANPVHLEPVTHLENLLRGDTIIARNARKTHCKRGHELTGANVRVRGTRRDCMVCNRELGLARYHARRAAERAA